MAIQDDFPHDPEDLDSEQEFRAWAGIRCAARLSHQTSLQAGWYNNPQTGEKVKRNFGEVIALMHSEISEALEADRKDLVSEKIPGLDARAEEFADCILRILDTCQALEIDVATALILKNRYNKRRLDHKLENRAAPGGKKY